MHLIFYAQLVMLVYMHKYATFEIDGACTRRRQVNVFQKQCEIIK